MAATDGVGGRLHVRYFYDAPLPNQLAASIQILRTGDALVDAGGRFTLHAGRLEDRPERILRDLNIEPRDGLRLVPCFAAKGGRLPRRVTLMMRLIAARREDLRHGEPGVAMTRGESAFPLLPYLEGRRRVLGWPRLLVYELHRLASLRAGERRLGRRASADDLAMPDIARIRTLERRAIETSDALVCLTSAVADAVRQEHGIEKPTLILPSGVEPSPSPAEARVPDVDVVYAGKLEARKGLFDLCDAMAFLPGRTLAIAGGPAEAADALRRRVVEQGLERCVHVVGWIRPAEVGAFLRRGRVGACPLRAGIDAVSDRFTSPMKLLEMMACGLPIVASDLAPVRAIAEDGRHALLVPPNDPRALALAIDRLLQDDGLAARLAEAAQARATSFAWQSRASRLRDFLLYNRDALAAAGGKR